MEKSQSIIVSRITSAHFIMQLKQGRNNWGRNLSTKGAICIFCDKECYSNDSFKHISPATKESNTFHMECFRNAVDAMILYTKSKKY